MGGLPGVAENFQILVLINRPQCHFAVYVIGAHVVVCTDIQMGARYLSASQLSLRMSSVYSLREKGRDDESFQSLGRGHPRHDSRRVDVAWQRLCLWDRWPERKTECLEELRGKEHFSGRHSGSTSSSVLVSKTV